MKRSILMVIMSIASEVGLFALSWNLQGVSSSAGRRPRSEEVWMTVVKRPLAGRIRSVSRQRMCLGLLGERLEIAGNKKPALGGFLVCFR
jgi:hypothetical protein